MQNERIELRLSTELVRRVDEWRMAQNVPPSRAAAIRHGIEVWLSRNASDARNECDTVVFTKHHDQTAVAIQSCFRSTTTKPPSQYSFDDSAEPDDPATLERRSP